jgi:uncharacterized protein
VRLVDTGFLLALLDKKNSRHSQTLTWAHSHAEGWITTWTVLTEAVYMLTTHLDARSTVHVMDDAASGVLQVWDIPLVQVGGLSALMKRYKALPMDLAAASLVLLAEHLGSGRILTTDQRDSAAYRWKNRQPFEDVMGMT